MTWNYVGIVGAEAAKFTPNMERTARELIRDLLRPQCNVLVSGRCPLGGIDVWAEEEYENICAIATEIGDIWRPHPLIFPPLTRAWSTGFQPRNEQIVNTSTEVHCIVVQDYIEGYDGRRWERSDARGKLPLCYHCDRRARELRLLPGTVPVHVKSGACWTAYEAYKLGKPALWHVIRKH